MADSKENKEGFSAGPALNFFPNPQPAAKDAKNPLTTRPPPIPEACTYDDLEPEWREMIRRGMAGKPTGLGSQIKGALGPGAMPPLPPRANGK